MKLKKILFPFMVYLMSSPSFSQYFSTGIYNETGWNECFPSENGLYKQSSLTLNKIDPFDDTSLDSYQMKVLESIFSDSECKKPLFYAETMKSIWGCHTRKVYAKEVEFENIVCGSRSWGTWLGIETQEGVIKAKEWPHGLCGLAHMSWNIGLQKNVTGLDCGDVFKTQPINNEVISIERVDGLMIGAKYYKNALDYESNHSTISQSWLMEE